VAREYLREEVHRPLLHLSELHVVDACTEGVIDCIPSSLPADTVLINQDPQHLYDRYGSVGLVQVNRVVLLKLREVLRDLKLVVKPPKDILQSRCHVEVLLLQPDLLVLLEVIIRVEY